jgi:hypothetical protein
MLVSLHTMVMFKGMWDFRFSWQKVWKWQCSGTQRCVVVDRCFRGAYYLRHHVNQIHLIKPKRISKSLASFWVTEISGFYCGSYDIIALMLEQWALLKRRSASETSHGVISQTSVVFIFLIGPAYVRNELHVACWIENCHCPVSSSRLTIDYFSLMLYFYIYWMNFIYFHLWCSILYDLVHTFSVLEKCISGTGIQLIFLFLTVVVFI